jgi:CubicO group peptidase (beta-lactamase class C family)
MPHLSAATAAWAAGAMAASARDLARWGDALYAGEVLPRGLRAEMLDFGGDAYGLGARTDRFAGRRAVGHLGGIRGFVLALWHFRAEDITVVVLVNRGIASTDPVTKAIARALFGGAADDADAQAPSGIAPELMPRPARDPMR